MSGRGRVRSAISVLLVPSLLAACDPTPDTSDAPPAAQSAVVWDTLGSWSGSGSRQTASFEFTSGSLRMIWAAHEAEGPGPGHFRVSLHSSISGRPLDTVVDVQGAGADTVVFSAEPHVAYLRIESEQVEWRITLEEGSPRVR